MVKAIMILAVVAVLALAFAGAGAMVDGANGTGNSISNTVTCAQNAPADAVAGLVHVGQCVAQAVGQ